MSTETPCYTMVSGPFGDLLVATDDRQALSRVWLPPAHPRPGWIRADDLPVLAEARRQLTEYFAGERRDFDLPLNPRGSDQARQVWQLIAEIPYGQTTSYGELAGRFDGDLDPRDIGAFVGQNPLSIFIPCHRVVGSTGKLTGYAGGLDRKRYLLELENAIPAAPETLW